MMHPLSWQDGPPRNRGMALCAVWVLCLMLAAVSPALAAPWADIVNPQTDDNVSVVANPNTYLVNGRCYQADEVWVQLDSGAAQQATLMGNTWEYALALDGGMTTGAHTLTVTAVSQGIAAETPATVSFNVVNDYPSGSLMLMPSSIVPTIYAGTGGPWGEGGLPLNVQIRAIGGEAVITSAELSSTTSPTVTYTLDLRTVNQDDSGALCVPALYALTMGPDGLVTVSARYLEGATWSATYNRSVIVDTTRPTLAATIPSYATGLPVITGTTSDANGVVRVSVSLLYPDGTTVVTHNAELAPGSAAGIADPAAWGWTPPSALAAGTYQVTITATDSAGNLSLAQTGSIVVDTTAPTGALAVDRVLDADGNYYYPDAVTDNIVFTITANDANIASWVLQDNGAATAISGVANVAAQTYNYPTATKDGRHTFRLVVTDQVGTSTTVDLANPVMIIAPPTPVVTAPTAGQYLKGNVTVAGSNGTAYAASWTLLGTGLATAPNGTGSFVSYNWDTTASSDGSHSVQLRVTDKAGVTATSAAVAVTIDNTAPAVTITSPPDGAIISGTVSVTATVVEANPSAWRLLGTGLATDPSGAGAFPGYSWNTTSSADGAHALQLQITDLAGSSTLSAPVDVTVINTGAAPQITNPVDGSFVKGTVTIAGTSGTATPKSWRLLGTGISPDPSGLLGFTSYSWNTVGLDGPHALQLEVTDLVDSVQTSTTVNVTVDNGTPAPTISAPAANALFSTATVAIAGTVGTSHPDTTKVVVLVDGSSVTPVAVAAPDFSTTYTTAAEERTHTIVAQVTNLAGTMGQSAPRTFRVDRTGPRLKIDIPVEGASVRNPVTISGSIIETWPGSATLTVTPAPPGGSTGVYDLGTTTGSFTVTLPDLTVGQVYTATLTATDEAGNAGASVTAGDETVSFTVVSTPTAKLTLLAAAGAVNENGTPVTPIADPSNSIYPDAAIYLGAAYRVAVTGAQGILRGDFTNQNGWRLQLNGTTLDQQTAATNPKTWSWASPPASLTTEGALAFRLVALNGAGEQSAPATITATYSETPPTIGVSYPPLLGYPSPSQYATKAMWVPITPGSSMGLRFRITPTNGVPLKVVSDVPQVTLQIRIAVVDKVKKTWSEGALVGATYNLAAAVRGTSSTTNGTATLSGSAKTGYTVVWNIPIGKSVFKVGQQYVVTVSNAEDVVSNQSAAVKRFIRIGLN